MKTMPAHHRPISAAQVRSLQNAVYRYFGSHRRDLPWRRIADPYCIYVSEVMLQQTQVDQVARKFPAFIRRFPDWESLAKAPLSAVLAAWQGLGYNRRAKFLKSAAEEVVGRFCGTLPSDPVDLATLPGIGAATAASVAAFGFNRPTVFIETNIRSVFIHRFFPGRRSVDDAELLPLVEQALDRRHPARWYSALMDYGTALKRVEDNPARRSRHHVRQSRFEGSQRQVRGMVVRQLLAAPGMTASALASVIGRPLARVADAVRALVDEGMMERRGRRLYIRS